VSLRDLFDDLHIPVPSNPTIDYDAVKLPKLWGVIKMESNLAVLQQIGIDLGIAGVLEVNTTQHLKDETLTLEGIPGDELQQTNRPDPTPPLINLLNAGTLPQSLRNLFTTSPLNITLSPTVQVQTVLPGSLWRVIDAPNKKQYFFQVKDVSALPAANASLPITPVPPDLKFLLRGETQAFHLQKKTFLIEAYGRAIFRLPLSGGAAANTQPELFRAVGVFSLKLSTTRLEVFADGQITLSPNGQRIFDLRAQFALIITTGGFAGKYMLGASVQLPGVSLSGKIEAYLNTFGTDQVITLSEFLAQQAGFNNVSIPGKPLRLNPDFDPTNANSVANDAILVPDTRPETAATPYFVIAARADISLLNAVALRGAYRIAASFVKV